MAKMEMAKMLKHWPSEPHSVHATELARMLRIGTSENPTSTEPTMQCVCVKQESMAVHKVLHVHEGRVCSS